MFNGRVARYRMAGIFRGAKFSVARYKPHPIATTRRFVGKYFVVRFSTTKTTKILPLKNYPLYGIYNVYTMYVYIYIYIFIV